MLPTRNTAFSLLVHPTLIYESLFIYSRMSPTVQITVQNEQCLHFFRPEEVNGSLYIYMVDSINKTTEYTDKYGLLGKTQHNS